MSSPSTTRPRPSRLPQRLAFLGPGLVFTGVFVAFPVLLVMSYTVFHRGRFGGIVHEASLDNFRRALEPIYRSVILDSVVIAGTATLVALAIGYPAAYAIARLPGRWRTIALIGVVIPFWTSFLIRTYAWIVLLNSQGVINDLLIKSGLINDRVDLLYNRGAVIVGLVYAYLPLMILPIYASVARLDPQLGEAGADLGASRMRTFRDITWPMSLPGVITGCIFVFVPSMGNFVIPELLGGGKTVMIGNVIRDQFLKARDWPFGATLALVMVVILALLFVVQSLVARRYTSGGPESGAATDAAGLRWGGRSALIGCFAFLYLPILTVVVLSFNTTRFAFNFSGFSLRWYGDLFTDAAIGEALVNSLIVAVGTTVLATVLGTTLAVGLVRYARSTALDAFAMAPAILPDLVLAIGLLSAFSLMGITLGLTTVLIAHAAFGTAFVVAVVRARLVHLDTSLEEASMDLGAGWVSTFFRITLPGIAPAVIAGALLAFTLSLDEFVIAFFTNGPDTPTLPIEIYSRVRFGITPAINALATVLLVISSIAVVVVARVFRERPESSNQSDPSTPSSQES